MKTKFELDVCCGEGEIEIIGTRPKYIPYVSITINGNRGFIKDKNLEKFAVNILKALKSRKLSEARAHDMSNILESRHR